MSALAFSQIWNSSDKQWQSQGLQQFFSGDQELGQIQKSLSPLKAVNLQTSTYGGHKLIQSLLRRVYSALSMIFTWLQLQKCANYFDVRKIHCSYNLKELNLSSQTSYLKTHLLTPMRNVHQLQTEDFYLHSPIGSSKFCSPKGVCRGISKWFTYLYLKAQSLSSHTDTDQKIQAVAQLFTLGAPPQSTLVQAAIPHIEKDYLSAKFKKTKDVFFTSNAKFIVDLMKQTSQIELDQQDGVSSQLKKKKSIQKALEEIKSKSIEEVASLALNSSLKIFKNVKEGVYTVSTRSSNLVDGKSKLSGHAMTYIKISPDLAYLMDPNVGVIKMKGKDNAQKAHEYISRYTKDKIFFLRERVLADVTTTMPS